MRNVFVFFGKRTIVPMHTSYPTLYSYLVSPLIAGNTALLYLTGTLRNLTAVVLMNDLHPLTVRWPARALSLLALLACSVTMGLFVSRKRNLLAGVATGGALLVTPSLLQYSSFALPDVTMMLLVAISLLQSLRLVQSEYKTGRLPVPVALGGFLAGLATACKYTGIVAICPVLVAIGLIWRKKRISGSHALQMAAVACLAMLGGFLLGCPGWLLAPHSFWEGLALERRHMAIGHIGAGGIPLLGQFELLIAGSPTFAIASLIGIAMWLKRRDESGWVALSLMAATLLMTSSAQKQSVQYLFPLLPASALFIGWLVYRWSQRIRSTVVVIGLVGLLAVPLCRIWAKSLVYLGPCSTAVAEKWIYQNVAPDSIIAVDWAYVPNFYSNEDLHRLRQSRRGQAAPYLLDELERRIVTYDPIPIQHSVDWLNTTDARVLVTSAGCYRRFFKYGFFTSLPPSARSPLYDEFHRHRMFYEALLEGEEDMWYLAYRVNTDNGPETLIYRRRSAETPS